MKWKPTLFLAVTAVLFLCVSRASAFDWDPITDAEKNMKSNPLDPGAGAVVLFKRGTMEVFERSSNWAMRIHTYARIKVFNDAGREAANIAIETPKYLQVSKVEGRSISPSGQIIPLDSSKVFRSKVYESGKDFAIIQTSFTFPSVEPGSIIEYSIDEFAPGFDPPAWIFDTRGMGTLESSLKFTTGSRLSMSNYQLDTTVTKIAVTQADVPEGTEFDFSTKNLRPIPNEPFSLPFRDLATIVLFSPYKLAFGNNVYPIYTKWDDVATEVGEWTKDTFQKSEGEAKKKAKELAGGIQDPRQKAESIYKYIQQNIASSNVVGVGLVRTADELMAAKQGDADEINALFVEMLKEAKVDANVVLVATQNWQALVPNFPGIQQFSRMITRINLKDGPIYADAADPGAPFGQLPWFERGVTGMGVIVNVMGGKLQTGMIPVGSPEDNSSSETVTVRLAKDGGADCDAQVELKGARGIEFRDDLLNGTADATEQELHDYFTNGRSGAEVSSITHPDLKDSSQPVVVKGHIKEKLLNEAGPGELLVSPWLYSRNDYPVLKSTQRFSALRFEWAEKRVSTSTWELASELKVEQLPKEEKIDNDLGTFSSSCTQNGSTVTCTRTYYLKKTFSSSPSDYANARKFFDQIAKDDEEVMVLHAE